MVKRLAKKTKLKVFSGIIILGLIGGIAWSLFNPGESDAAWFDDTYAYRTIYTFTHNAALTNRRIDITINTSTLVTAGKMQADCDDSRFTDITGKKLRYQLVSGCNTSSTSYSVVIPTVINGLNTYYFYYGNPLATSLSDSTVSSVTSVTPSGGAPSAGSEEQGPRPLLYWKLDEGTGTTANDTSSNSNSGTLAASTANPTWQTEDQCINGKCLKFDGSNDYLSRTYSSDTELAPGTASFTITAWTKHPSTISGTDTIISRSNGAVNGIGYKLYMNSSGFICFGIDDDATSFPEDSACSTTSYADSKWHFIEGVKSTTASITLYIDGIQIAQDASISATGTLSGTTATLFAGIDSDASSNPWDGYIDEIKYYNYAKSAAQVKSDFASKGAVEDTAVSFGAKDQSVNLSQGLVGYWKLDESSGQTKNCTATPFVDASGNSWNGSSCPSSTGPDGGGTGKFAGAVTLDGTNDYISIPSYTALNGSNAFTVSAWVNFNSSMTEKYIAWKLSQFDVRIGTNDMMISVATSTGGGNIRVTPTLSGGAWHLATYTYTGSNINIYLDGVLQGSTLVTGTVSNGSNDLQLGASNGGSNLAGSMDDIRIYNRALSQQEINALYDWAPGPSAYWKLDDHTGTSALDSSTNANSATLTNGPTWKPGKYGSGVLFDGSNDYAVITDASSLQIGANESVTLSAWFKTSQTDGTILSKNGTSLSDVYDLKLNFGCLRIDAKDSSFNGANTFGTNRCGLNDNVWHYGAFTYDRLTGVSKLYVDGILDISQTQSPNPTGAIGSTANAYIGSEGGTGNFFTGYLDDIKIYKYARTAKQIIQDMNANAPSIGGPGTPGNAVAYWSMDEGQGTTANDKSGNSKSLTLNTASWTNSGAFGKAWNGLGTNWLSRSDDNDLDFAASDDFSISMWIKSDSASNPGGAEYLLSKLESSAGYRLRFNSSGQIGFAIDDDSTFTPDDEAVTTTDYYDNTWHHVVAVKTGTSKIELFVDGKSVASDTSLAATGSLANSITMYLGDRNGVDGGDEFNGDIDEVKIYRFALNPDEIKADFNQGSSQKLGSLSTASNGTTADNSSAREYCVPGDTTTCNAPVAEWKLDERTGTTANDSSGNGFTGTLNGATTWKVGKIGSAVNFTNTSGDYINVGDYTTLDFGASQDFTLEAWVYRTGATEQDAIFGKKNVEDSCSSDPGYSFYITTAGLAKAWGCDNSNNSYNAESASTLANNTWYHVAFVWDDDSTANTGMYINGRKDFGSNSGTLTSVGDLSNALTLKLGSEADGGKNMNGSLDQMRIYNYARSPAQIAWDYNKGAPIVWYKFDECQGTTVNDASGNGLTGTISPGAGTYTSAGTCNSGSSSEIWNNGTTGKFSSGIALDGTDDTITVPDNTIFNLNTATISSWVKLTQTSSAKGSDQFILDKVSSSTPFLSFVMRVINSSNTVQFCFTNASVTVACETTTSALSAGIWYHLTGVYDGTNVIGYINGKEDGSRATLSGSLLDSSGVFRISGDVNPANYTGGILDDVRLYNYALTPVQIKTLVNENAAVRFGQ